LRVLFLLRVGHLFFFAELKKFVQIVNQTVYKYASTVVPNLSKYFCPARVKKRGQSAGLFVQNPGPEKLFTEKYLPGLNGFWRKTKQYVLKKKMDWH